MKKNLFLLFAVYFFVIQSFVAWFLWKENNLFALWIINLWVIFIIVLGYSYFEKFNKKAHDEDTVSFKKEREAVLSQKPHTPKNHKNKTFWISFLVWIIAFFLLEWYLLSSKIIISSGIAFIIFIIFFYTSKSHKHNKFLKLWSSKVYIIIFIIWIIISWFDTTIPWLRQETAVWCIINLVSNSWKYTTPKTVEKTKVDSTQTDIEYNTSDWNTQDQIIETWYVISWDSTSQPISIINNQNLNDNYLYTWELTILEAIKYLIDQNNIPLDTRQNTKFTYISYQNPDYPYFKTALSKRMIWTNTNPDKKIICQTYIVMKWLAESWEIVNTWDPLKSYRDKASQLSKLNWCEKNKYVTYQNL